MFRPRVGKFTICLSLKLRLILETFKLLKSPSRMTPLLGKRDSIVDRHFNK